MGKPDISWRKAASSDSVLLKAPFPMATEALRFKRFAQPSAGGHMVRRYLVFEPQMDEIVRLVS